MLATGGGFTFGGGEPLLYPDLMTEVQEYNHDGLSVFVETSLHVASENIIKAASNIDHFYVDIKTLDKEKYRAYANGENSLVITNLKLLLNLAGSDHITVRIPLIPGLTTTEDRERDKDILKEWGFTDFDLFEYMQI